MFDSYKIESGDTIQSVAKKFNMSIDDLFKVNKWNLINLQEGEVINILDNKNNYLDKYTVVKGDTLYSISNKYNISKEDLALLNGLELDEYLYPDQVIYVPKNNVGVYITRDNDTLKSIIENNNINPNDIYRLNSNIFIVPDQLIVYRKN